MAQVDVNAAMGKVGLPAPIRELASRDWDAVVVGGGHNGLTAAAYLARAGRSVLVLERRERLGGACTLERPFPDQRYLISPCAYVVGLLDELVVNELELAAHGYRVIPADPSALVPVRRRLVVRRRSWTATAPSPTCATTASPSADIAGVLAYEDAVRAHPARCSARARRRHLARRLAEPGRDRGDPGRRRGADLDRLRGVDRRDARSLRRATSGSRTRSWARG